MQLLDLSLSSPAENVALDEALLDEAEQAGSASDVLRLWEPARPMVVVGRSSRVEREVHLDECLRREIPIVRRSSGGAAIVAAPGCLLYAVVLGYEGREELRMIDRAHLYVLDRLAGALGRLLPGVVQAGTSDLAIGDRKFSGNSLRCKRTHFLYHGTLLYGMSLDLVGRCLKAPARQPDYRRGRDHERFVTNLPLQREALCDAVAQALGATEARTTWPTERVARLVQERYGRDDWTRRFDT
jgi:lipoate-protein ligase A